MAPEVRRRERREEWIFLQRYLTDVLEVHGAAVDTSGYALVEALLPPELAASLELPEEVQLAFDYEVAHENPGAEFVTFGSPLLDRAVALGLETGRVTRKVATATSLAVPPDMATRIQKQLDFVRCRPVLRSATLVRVESVLFHFRSRFVSDEKQEDVYPVMVDTATGQEVNYQLAWLPRVFFVPQEPEVEALPLAEHCGYAAAYAKAREALPRVIVHDLAQFQARMQRFLQEEADRLADYYRQTLAEARQRMQRASDAARQERLEKKVRAIQADYEKRAEDIRGKYQVVVEAEVDSVVIYVMPEVRLTLDLERGSERTTMTLYYNLAASALEHPVCPRCLRPMAGVAFDRKGGCCCGDCARG